MHEEAEMAGDSAMTLIRMEGAVSLFANCDWLYLNFLSVDV